MPMTADRRFLSVVHVASVDRTRYAMESVLLDTDGSAVATDGKILAVIANGQTPGEGFKARKLDRRAVLKLRTALGKYRKAIIPDRPTEPIKLTAHRKKPAEEVAPVLCQGPFPPYQDVLGGAWGKASEATLELSVEELEACVEPFSGRFNLVRWALYERKAVLYSRVGGAALTLELGRPTASVARLIPTLEFHLAADLTLRVFQVAREAGVETVTIKFHDDKSAVTFEGKAEGLAFRALQMPVRV